MKLFVLVMAAGTLASADSLAFDACPPIVAPQARHYQSGLDCLRMSDHDMHVYAAGMVDAISASSYVGSNYDCVSAITRCLSGRNSVQVGGVVRKYIRDNPERWDAPCAILGMEAVRTWCRAFTKGGE